MGDACLVPRSAADWMLNGEHGVSSDTIFAVMIGATTPTRRAFGNWPHDPDDFRRCLLLIERVPEWNSRIGEMAKLGKEWAAVAAHWDEWSALFEEERAGRTTGGWTAPRLYDAMKAEGL